mgnify:CR=1 FL=1
MVKLTINNKTYNANMYSGNSSVTMKEWMEKFAVNQILFSEADPEAESLLIWTSADIQIPTYANLLSFEKVELDQIIEEVSQFAALIQKASKKYKTIFMLSWTFPPEKKWPLALSTKSNTGAIDVLFRMNIHLAESLSSIQNFHIIDQTTMISHFTENIHDPRLYALARIRYTFEYQKFIAQNIQTIIAASVDASRKIIICDLDNTLWGGIVGDDGINSLKIGGNDPIGEAHLQLQKELVALNNRGILLAISSKNDEKVAMNAIRNHPNMLLKESNFAAKRINWEDKAANILFMLKELNLLPSGAVFLDDNPTERQRVRDSLPDIIVPELPNDVSEWSGILNSLSCFETLSQSKEDLERAKNYKIEGERVAAQKLFGNLDDWLKSLDLVVEVDNLSSTNIQRATQLLNKTNQFNLRTRRLTELELMQWAKGGYRKCLNFSVSDRYGDSGLTAFVSFEKLQNNWQIVDFVMSCRVMGKGVENAIISEVIHNIGKGNKIMMEYIPSEKNNPIRDFTNGITNKGMVIDEVSCPKHIKIKRI